MNGTENTEVADIEAIRRNAEFIRKNGVGAFRRVKEAEAQNQVAIKADYETKTESYAERDWEDGGSVVAWTTYLFVKSLTGIEYGYGLTFKTEEEAEYFGKKVVKHGTINPKKWFVVSDPNAKPELPDYVLNPERPEYN